MRRDFFIAIVPVVLVFSPLIARAGEKAGTVVAVRGEVLLAREGTTEERALKLMDELFVHDRIITEKGAMIKILLTDDSVVTIDEKSSVNLAGYIYNTRESVRKGVFHMIVGRIRARLSLTGFAEEEFIIRTDNAVAGVKA